MPGSVLESDGHPQNPSAAELAGLQEKFNELEAGVDAFSVALERLTNARRSIEPSRKLLHQTMSHQYSQEVPNVKSRGAGEHLAWNLFAMALMMVASGTAMLQWWRQHKVRSRPAGYPREPGRTLKGDPCDVAFLAHPSSVLSAFALWAPEKRPEERWKGAWWMIPAWPLAVAVHMWNTYVSPHICGPYMLVDSFRYYGVENQVWLVRALGFQYMIKSFRPGIAKDIERAAREADRTGVEVLGLGALNKAEFINRGGEDVLNSFTNMKTRLVHGNTLTAAVVVENAKAAIGAVAAPTSHLQLRQSTSERRCVFLTGATSKVGRAVALKLALEGFDVVCCTRSGERFKALETEFAQLLAVRDHARFTSDRRNDGEMTNRSHESFSGDLADTEQSHVVDEKADFRGERSTRSGRLLRARRVDEGVHHRVWVVGKSDASVRQHIPLNASAVVFAVPCPLEGSRSDVNILSGGILRMDVTACTPRRFHVLLPYDQVYACHAAAVVHQSMGWRHHEIGKVEVGKMDITLRAARACGFAIPEYLRYTEWANFTRNVQNPEHTKLAPFSTMTIAARQSDSAVKSPTFLASIPSMDSETHLNCHDKKQMYDSNNGAGTGERNVTDKSSATCLPRPPHLSSMAATVKMEERLEARSERVSSSSLVQSELKSPTVPDEIAAQTGAARSHGFRNQPPLQLAHGCERRGNNSRTIASGIATESHLADGHLLASLPMEHGKRDALTAASDEVTGSPDVQRLPEFCKVVVVGAGASGLSAAGCLRRQGERDVLVLEMSSDVCGSWQRQYEGLRITTRRKHCGLPGWPIPGQGFCWDEEVSAPDFVRYLQGYRRRFDVDVITETEVLSANPGYAESATGFSDEGVICVQVRRGNTTGSFETATIRCQHLVIATGKNACPSVPTKVLHTLGGFCGEVLHSSSAEGLRALARRKVCIVGMGNSACDLATALLEHGAGCVHLSTRSAPPIIMREWGPLSLEWVSRVVQYMPARVVDTVLVLFGMAKWGRKWREKAFPKGLLQTWHARSSRRIPCIDKGMLVPALLDGRIAVHGPIEDADGHILRFQHSAAMEAFDVVVLATGFEPTHERLVNRRLLEGGLRKGVHLVGFDNGRALLPLRQIGKEAEQVATRIVSRQ